VVDIPVDKLSALTQCPSSLIRDRAISELFKISERGYVRGAWRDLHITVHVSVIAHVLPAVSL